MGRYRPKYASVQKKNAKKYKLLLFLVLPVTAIVVIGMLFFGSREDNDETRNQYDVSSNYETEVDMTAESPHEILHEADPTVAEENKVDITLVMNAAYNTLTSSEFGSIDFARYCLYDVTGDGTDELIIIAGTCEADAQLQIYAYSNGAFSSVGTLGGSHVGICGKTTGNGITLHNGHMGYETIRDVNIIDGEVVVLTLAENREAMEGYTEFDYCIPLEYRRIDDYSEIVVANSNGTK